MSKESIGSARGAAETRKAKTRESMNRLLRERLAASLNRCGSCAGRYPQVCDPCAADLVLLATSAEKTSPP
jgi:hypothetical protein